MLKIYNTPNGTILPPLPKAKPVKKPTMEELSQGALKDFQVLNFCGSLIEVSYTNPDGSIVRDKDNKDHKLNKRIDRRLKAVREQTKSTLNLVAKACTPKQQVWIKKRLVVVSETLHWLERHDINVNLELLALYVLFINFDNNERGGVPISPLYDWFAKSDNFMDTNADLIGGLLNGTTETDMFLLAYDIVTLLKK